MFKCTTEFACDICGTKIRSSGTRMTDCSSKHWFRYVFGEKGWKTIYGKYDVCPECVQRCGMKYIRKILKERETK